MNRTPPPVPEAENLELLTRYAPTRSSLTTWTLERENDVLDAVFRAQSISDVDSGAVLVESVAAQPAAPRRVVRWAPVLAAACVLALVVSLGLAFHDGTRNARAGGDAPQLQVHPWHARAISSVDIVGVMVGHAATLYAFAGVGSALVELDPGSGAVLARAAIPRTGSLRGPVYAGKRIWVASQVSPTRLRLTGFDLDLSSSVHRTITLPVIEDNVDFGMTAPVDGSTLYVSTGRQVLVLDPHTGRPRSRIAVSADPVSVSPDGKTLYAVNALHTAVTAVDTTTRQLLGHHPVAGAPDNGDAGQGSLNDLAATNDGYFIAAVLKDRPRYLTRFFYATGAVTRVRVNTGLATAVQSPTHAIAGVAWGSGAARLSCLDPRTGRVRARSATHGGSSQIYLTDLDDHLYGSYHENGSNGDSTSALIELSPPKACGLD